MSTKVLCILSNHKVIFANERFLTALMYRITKVGQPTREIGDVRARQEKEVKRD